MWFYLIFLTFHLILSEVVSIVKGIVLAVWKLDVGLILTKEKGVEWNNNC